MNQDNITELRRLMFEQMRALADASKTVDLDRAKAMSEAAQVIINSAKVEIDYMKATDSTTGTGFIPEAVINGPQAVGTTVRRTTHGGTTEVTAITGARIITHKAS